MKTNNQNFSIKDGELGADTILERLHAEFPAIFSSSPSGSFKLDLDVLRRIVGEKNCIDSKLERVSNEFGLRWDARQADRNFDEEKKSSLVVLNHSPELSVGEGPYQNMLIEGDNFDALRYLSVTHRGNVKCIYIDPPYNTGNNDFIYKDNFLDKDAPFRHSRWLAFMHARLLLAKDILAHDGVILVSIDDNEYHHLKMLMDQVFSGMYKATFVWKRRSGSNDAKGAFVSADHEYVLCYAGKDFSFGGEKKSFDNYTNPDGDVEPWIRGDLTCNKSYIERPNTFYPIQDPKTHVWYACNPRRVWWCASRDRLKAGQKLRGATMEDFISRGKILFPENDKKVQFDSLAALKEGILAGVAPGNIRADLYPDEAENDEYLSFFVGKTLGFGSPGYKRHLSEVKKTEKPLSTWVIPSSEKDQPESPEVEFLSWGYTAEGTKLIQDMLGTKAFSYPKPLSLVKALVEQATGPGDLVVDFFGGSGTTGHAVLAINAEHEDEEPRRFIVVSAAERTEAEPTKNICRDVTAARLRAAIEGYQVRKKTGFDSVAGLGGGFAYLKAESIPVANIGDPMSSLSGSKLHSVYATPRPASDCESPEEGEKEKVLSIEWIRTLRKQKKLSSDEEEKLFDVPDCEIGPEWLEKVFAA